MFAIYLLIGFSLLISVSFLIAFLYANKKGQFDDTYTPSVRMLFDDVQDNEKNKNDDNI